MKLSPPAGSSDLDQARSIARRLTAKLQPRGSGAVTTAPAGSVVFGSAPREPRAASVPAPEPPVPREAEPFVAPEPELAVAQDPGLAASADSLVDSLVAEPPQEFDPMAMLTGVEPLAVELPAPEPPSWEEVLERCQNLAQARAALLIDGDGRVAGSCGTWPSAGVDAVAAKLRPMLDKKEQSGVAASLSVRLGDRILTAWRLQLGEVRSTVAFLADVPLGADLRSTIEDELGTGAPL